MARLRSFLARLRRRETLPYRLVDLTDEPDTRAIGEALRRLAAPGYLPRTPPPPPDEP